MWSDIKILLNSYLVCPEFTAQVQIISACPNVIINVLLACSDGENKDGGQTLIPHKQTVKSYMYEDSPNPGRDSGKNLDT